MIDAASRCGSIKTEVVFDVGSIGELSLLLPRFLLTGRSKDNVRLANRCGDERPGGWAREEEGRRPR